MASFEYFDSVKAEKEDALWRYNMERKLRLGLRFAGLFLVFFLLSWSWFPLAVEVAGDCRRRFLSAFNNPLFTFILVNIIVVVVYFLSGSKHSHQQASTTVDIYDEYVSSRRGSLPTSAVETEEAVVDKQIVLVENAVAVSEPKQESETVETVTEPKRTVSPFKQQQQQEEEGRTMIRTDQVNSKEYRRSRSMVSASRNQEGLRRRPKEFRRSETAIGRELVVVSGEEPPRKSMEEMSSEEFRSIIDSFIAEKKKTLMQENTAHFTRRREKCMSIVVKN